MTEAHDLRLLRRSQRAILLGMVGLLQSSDVAPGDCLPCMRIPGKVKTKMYVRELLLPAFEDMAEHSTTGEQSADSGKPERLVMAILLVLPPLACLRHIFRQLSKLRDLAILDIIIKTCE